MPPSYLFICFWKANGEQSREDGPKYFQSSFNVRGNCRFTITLSAVMQFFSHIYPAVNVFSWIISIRQGEAQSVVVCFLWTKINSLYRKCASVPCCVEVHVSPTLVRSFFQSSFVVQTTKGSFSHAVYLVLLSVCFRPGQYVIWAYSCCFLFKWHQAQTFENCLKADLRHPEMSNGSLVAQLVSIHCWKSFWTFITAQLS